MRLWVDFNDETAGHLEADLDYASFFREDELMPGVDADLFDGAGHECKATVVAYDPATRTLDLRLLPLTWTSPLAREEVQVWAVPAWVANSTGNIVQVT